MRPPSPLSITCLPTTCLPLDAQIQTFDAPTFFAFHYANAFEDLSSGELHVDMAVYENPKILNDLALNALRAYPGQEVSRCVNTQ